MSFPENIFYTKTHEWVRFEEGTAVVGLTDHAQESMGSIVFVNLPRVGDTVGVGDVLSDVESVKAVSEVFSPVSGIVGAVNEEVVNDPERINNEPYEAWLVRIVDIVEKGVLMNSKEYMAYLIEEDKKH